MKTFRKYMALFIVVLAPSGIIALVIGSQEERYCGRIKYKIDATRFSKRSSYADPIFVVQFDFGTREMHPSWDAYMTYGVGDNICYHLINPKYGQKLNAIGMALIGMSLFAALIYCFSHIDD